MALSMLLALALGGCLWLLLGDRLPPGAQDKWPASSNILCYAALLLAPLYLCLFFAFADG